ncbi:hypothetical protein CYMTET_33639 [Cymbomonas tetramitiformis]|uniref:Protein NLRC3 n=1 Tax=Cymbomonas tetramitiformis TaxID=36881 RepID=A0AAE0KQP1_9CHLO|nr:hypothetical protein CYMTET_33639 [Cymbomonas tetramitiformis]
MLADKQDVFEVLLTTSINLSLNIAKDTILLEFHLTVKCILQLPYVLVVSVLFSPVTFILDAGYFSGRLHKADITLVAVCYEIALVLYPLAIFLAAKELVGDEQVYVSAMVLLFLFFLQAPVVWICAFRLPRDPQATTIQQPSREIRYTLQNINALFSIFLEAWTLNSLCFQLATQHPDSVKVAFKVFLFDFGPHLWTVSVGAAIVISFLFSFCIGVLGANKGVMTAPGKFAQLITASLPIFTGPLFMSTISELLGVLDCTSLKDDDTSHRRLYLDASLTYRGYEPDLSLSEDKIQCFTSPHKELTAIALLAAVLFFPCATLSPYGSMPAFTHPNLDIKTVPIFTIIERLIKVNAMVFSTLYSTMPHTFLPVLLVSNTTLLLCNVIFMPCCIPYINHLKSSLYAFSVWTVLVTWAAEFVLDLSLGGESRSDLKWFVFLSVLFGFLCIFTTRNGQDIFKHIMRRNSASKVGRPNSKITTVNHSLEECIQRLAWCKEQLSLLEKSEKGARKRASTLRWNNLAWRSRGELRKRMQFSPVRTRIYIEKSLFELDKLAATAGHGDNSNAQVAEYLLKIISAEKIRQVSNLPTGEGHDEDDKPNSQSELKATHDFCHLFGLKLLQANILNFLADCLLPDLRFKDLTTTQVDANGFIAWDRNSYKSTRLAVEALLTLLKHNKNRGNDIAWQAELEELCITYDQRIMQFDNHVILRKLICCLDFKAAATDCSSVCQTTDLVLKCIDELLEGNDHDKTELLDTFIEFGVQYLLVVFLAPPKFIELHGRLEKAPKQRSKIRQQYEERALQLLNRLRKHRTEVMEQLLQAPTQKSVIPKLQIAFKLSQNTKQELHEEEHAKAEEDEEANQASAVVGSLIGAAQVTFATISNTANLIVARVRDFLIRQGIEGLEHEDGIEGVKNCSARAPIITKPNTWQVLGALERLIILNSDADKLGNLDGLLPPDLLRTLMPMLVTLVAEAVEEPAEEGMEEAVEREELKESSTAPREDGGGLTANPEPSDQLQQGTERDTGRTTNAQGTDAKGNVRDAAGVESAIPSEGSMPRGNPEESLPYVNLDEEMRQRNLACSKYWAREGAVACLRAALERNTECTNYLLMYIDRDEDQRKKDNNGVTAIAAIRALHLVLQRAAQDPSAVDGAGMCRLRESLQKEKGLNRLVLILYRSAAKGTEGNEGILGLQELQKHTERCLALMADDPEIRKRMVEDLDITMKVEKMLSTPDTRRIRSALEMLKPFFKDAGAHEDPLVDMMLTQPMLQALCEAAAVPRGDGDAQEECLAILEVWCRGKKLCGQLHSDKTVLSNVLRALLPAIGSSAQAHGIMEILHTQLHLEAPTGCALLQFYLDKHLHRPDCYNAESNEINISFEMTEMDWTAISAALCLDELKTFKINVTDFHVGLDTFTLFSNTLVSQAEIGKGPERLICYGGNMEPREMPLKELRRMPDLHEIRLRWSGKGLQTFEAKLLAAYFKNPVALVEMDLSDNCIGDNGCIRLVQVSPQQLSRALQALKWQPRLTRLDLANNNIGSEGLEAIALALRPGAQQPVEEWLPAATLQQWSLESTLTTWSCPRATTDARAAARVPAASADTRGDSGRNAMPDATFSSLHTLCIRDNPRRGELAPLQAARMLSFSRVRSLRELDTINATGHASSDEESQAEYDDEDGARPSSQMTEYDANHAPLDEYMCVFIAQQLRQTKPWAGLTSLRLTGSLLKMTLDQIALSLTYLGTALAENAALQELHLDNNLRMESLSIFGRALFPEEAAGVGNQGLRYVKVARKLLPLVKLRAPDKQRHSAAASIQEDSGALLDLSCMHLREEDVAVIAAALRMSTNFNLELEEISLIYNEIGPEGVRELMTCIPERCSSALGRHVTTLRLSGNPVRDQGAKYVQQALEKGHWRWLKQLEMFDTELSEEAVNELQEAIARINQNYGASIELLYDETNPEYLKELGELHASFEDETGLGAAPCRIRKLSKDDAIDRMVPLILAMLRKEQSSVEDKHMALLQLHQLLDCTGESNERALQKKICTYRHCILLKCLTMLLLHSETRHSLWGNLLHNSASAAPSSPMQTTPAPSRASPLPQAQLEHEYGALEMTCSATLQTIDTLFMFIELDPQKVVARLVKYNTHFWVMDFILPGNTAGFVDLGELVHSRVKELLLRLLQDARVLRSFISTLLNATQPDEARPVETMDDADRPGFKQVVDLRIAVGPWQSTIDRLVSTLSPELPRKVLMLFTKLLGEEDFKLPKETLLELMRAAVELACASPFFTDGRALEEWEETADIDPTCMAGLELLQTLLQYTHEALLESFLGPTFYNVCRMPLVASDADSFVPDERDTSRRDLGFMASCCTALCRLLLAERLSTASAAEPSRRAPRAGRGADYPSQPVLELLLTHNLFSMSLCHFLYFQKVARRTQRQLEMDACQAQVLPGRSLRPCPFPFLLQWAPSCLPPLLRLHLAQACSGTEAPALCCSIQTTICCACPLVLPKDVRALILPSAPRQRGTHRMRRTPAQSLHRLRFAGTADTVARRHAPGQCELVHLLKSVAPSFEVTVEQHSTKPLMGSLLDYLDLVAGGDPERPRDRADVKTVQMALDVLSSVYRHVPEYTEYLTGHGLLARTLSTFEMLERWASLEAEERPAWMMGKLEDMLAAWAAVPMSLPEAGAMPREQGESPTTVLEEINTSQVKCLRLLACLIRLQPFPASLAQPLNSLLVSLKLKHEQESFTHTCPLRLLCKCGFRDAYREDPGEGLTINIAAGAIDWQKQGAWDTYWQLVMNICEYQLTALHLPSPLIAAWTRRGHVPCSASLPLLPRSLACGSARGSLRAALRTGWEQSTSHTQRSPCAFRGAKALGRAVGLAARRGCGPCDLHLHKRAEKENKAEEDGVKGVSTRITLPRVRIQVTAPAQGIPEVPSSSPRKPAGLPSDEADEDIKLQGEGFGWPEMMVILGFMEIHTHFTSIDCSFILKDADKLVEQAVVREVVAMKGKCKALRTVKLYGEELPLKKLAEAATALALETSSTDMHLQGRSQEEVVVLSAAFRQAEMAVLTSAAASNDRFTAFFATNNTKVNEWSFDYIATMASESRSLLILDLSGTCLSTAQVEDLAKMLKENESLRVLKLNGVDQLKLPAVQQLGALLQVHPALKELQLRGRDPSSPHDMGMHRETSFGVQQDMAPLADALLKRKALTHLDLNYRFCGPMFAKKLAQAMHSSNPARAISKLHLRGSKLGEKGLKEIAKLLELKSEAKSITYLDISDNQLTGPPPDEFMLLEGQSGIGRLKGLAADEALPPQQLHPTYLQGLIDFAACWKRNNTLKELDLSNNYLGDDGAKELADAIKPDLWGGNLIKTKLTRFSVARCGIGDKGARALCDALKAMYESNEMTSAKVTRVVDMSALVCKEKTLDYLNYVMIETATGMLRAVEWIASKVPDAEDEVDSWW